MLPPQMKIAAGLRPTPMANITKAVSKATPTAPVARPLSARFPGTEENLRKNMGLAPGSPATPLSAHIPGTDANLQAAAARAAAPAKAAPAAPAKAAPAAPTKAAPLVPGTREHAAAAVAGTLPVNRAPAPAAAPAKPSLVNRVADAVAPVVRRGVEATGAVARQGAEAVGRGAAAAGRGAAAAAGAVVPPVVRGAGAGLEAAGDALGAAGTKALDVASKGVDKLKEVGSAAASKAKEVASTATAPAGELTGAGKADSILNSIKLRHLPMAGAAAGMALGAIAPGTDEDGKKKSRIEGALMGGLTGGALSGLGMLPFAGGRKLYNTYAAPHMQMRAPAAPAAPAAPGKRTAALPTGADAGGRSALGGNTKRLAPGDPAAVVTPSQAHAAPADAPTEVNVRRLRSQSLQQVAPSSEGIIDVGLGHPQLQALPRQGEMPLHARQGTPEHAAAQADALRKLPPGMQPRGSRFSNLELA